MSAKRKLLIVQIAGLDADFVQREKRAGAFRFQRIEAGFPAMTCPAQATFRTASQPHAHGMVANGVFARDLRKILFWEQAASLVEGGRIWEKFRASGRSVGMMFWQQSLGEALDLVLSPAPIHKHSGGMIQELYGHPMSLPARLAHELKRPFNLMHYWGPLASRKSSDWIVDATCAVMRMPDIAPDLLFSYIPHLDYDLQRRGPKSRRARRALAVVLDYIGRLQTEAAVNGYETLFFGDYAIEPATGGVIFPNRRLREAGLLETRPVKKMSYADFFASRAFAMADHQIAHVFTSDEKAAADAKAALLGLPGVETVLDREAQSRHGANHARGGDLLLIAQPGAWFAYPWWSERAEAPDFASHVDIHNKPGYDPCELFFGWPPPGVSQNPQRIRGTHGRPGESVAWTSSLEFAAEPASLLDLARLTKVWLDAQASGA